MWIIFIRVIAKSLSDNLPKITAPLKEIKRVLEEVKGAAQEAAAALGSVGGGGGMGSVGGGGGGAGVTINTYGESPHEVAAMTTRAIGEMDT